MYVCLRAFFWEALVEREEEVNTVLSEILVAFLSLLSLIVIEVLKSCFGLVCLSLE